MARGKRRTAPIIDGMACFSYDDLALSNIATIENSPAIKDTIDAIIYTISSDKITVEGENISLTEKIKQMESKKKKKIKKITVRF